MNVPIDGESKAEMNCFLMNSIEELNAQCKSTTNACCNFALRSELVDVMSVSNYFETCR